MTPRRRQRLIGVAMVLVGVGLAAALALRAFQENLLYFYSPSQVLNGEAPAASRFRVGGLVEAGTLDRTPGELELRFSVTDLDNRMVVAYAGVLPDLFREGQGIIAYGRLDKEGMFVADELLAKHDENYMPGEVKEMLESRGHPGTAAE